MVINESYLRGIIRNVLREYLDKEYMAPVYRRVNNGDQTKTFKMAEQPSLFKEGWLVHFTKYNNALDIMKNGFKYSMARNEIDNIFWRPDVRNTGPEGYSFAYDPNTSFDFELARISYGNTMVMFKAHGMKFFHNKDREWEVVFKNTVAHDFVLITWNGQSGKCMVGNRGNGHSLYEGNYNEVFNWVMNNYDQYKNILSNAVPENAPKRMNRSERAKELGIDLKEYLYKMNIGRDRYKKGFSYFTSLIKKNNAEELNIVDSLINSNAYALKNGNIRCGDMYNEFIEDWGDDYSEKELNNRAVMFNAALGYLINDYGKDSVSNDLLSFKKKINDDYWDVYDAIKEYTNETGRLCKPLYSHIDYPYLGSYDDILTKMEGN